MKTRIEKIEHKVRYKLAQHMASEFKKIQKGQLELCCKLVIDASLSTGHADTIEDLVLELISQAQR